MTRSLASTVRRALLHSLLCGVAIGGCFILRVGIGSSGVNLRPPVGTYLVVTFYGCLLGWLAVPVAVVERVAERARSTQVNVFAGSVAALAVFLATLLASFQLVYMDSMLNHGPAEALSAMGEWAAAISVQPEVLCSFALPALPFGPMVAMRLMGFKLPAQIAGSTGGSSVAIVLVFALTRFDDFVVPAIAFGVIMPVFLALGDAIDDAIAHVRAAEAA